MAPLDPHIKALANSVAHADDMESFVRPLLKVVNRCSGLGSVYLTIIDEEQGIQRVWFSENESSLQIDEGLSVPWDDTLCKRALEEGRYVTNDVARCWSDSQAAQELNIQTYASVPVHTLDQSLFGTLCGASDERLDVEDDIVDLLHLCSELIAAQLTRSEQVVAAERRALMAQTRMGKIELSSKVSRYCLESDDLQQTLVKVADLLRQDPSWHRIDVFIHDNGRFEAIEGDSPHGRELVNQVMEGDKDALQLIVRNLDEPVIWADPEEQTLALVITSDDSVEAIMLVYMDRDVSQCPNSMLLLNSSAYSLSLLASRLADHQRLEAANQVLEQHALHDALTGLPNRRYLVEMLDEKLAEGERLETQIYIAFIDLDGFKALNDEHGHDFGDLFLQAFSERLSSVLRGHDLVARYGGDEFVFVALGNPDDEFLVIRERLVERIRSATSGVYKLEGITLEYAGPSIGMIEWQPGELRDADITISRADTAMYEDKKRRRESR